MVLMSFFVPLSIIADVRADWARAAESARLSAKISEIHGRRVIALRGEESQLRPIPFDAFPGVERVVRLDAPYHLAAREFHERDSVVPVGETAVGGGHLALIAGPCAVEDADQLLATARAARECGANVLRGGAFKPRTSPYEFRGLGVEGLRLLAEASREVGLPVVTEAMDTRHLEDVVRHADMVQIGTRNMQNYPLLEEAGRTGLPVLLKRGRACTVAEWLCAAEYVLNTGNHRVVLCERGLVAFDPAVRNLLDLSAVPLVKRLSHLPVVVDPSHGTGHSELVPAMARAAVAAGADGVMVEVHPRPERALSDARQALRPPELRALVTDLRAISEIVQRRPACIS
ncbi:MAG: 3-deoxy-7-phosphoheptulonate synthase [Planctomycetota bacterium]